MNHLISEKKYFQKSANRSRREVKNPGRPQKMPTIMPYPLIYDIRHMEVTLPKRINVEFSVRVYTHIAIR